MGLTFIQKNTNIALVIQNGGIWFANGKFGTTWKMVQAVVQPKATLRGKCHIRLGASEEEEVDQTAAEDSDEEVDPADIASEVKAEVKKAEVEAPPKKKVVKKKVKKAVVDE